MSIVDLRGQLPIRPGRAYYTRPLSGIVGVTIHYTASTPRSGVNAVIAIADYQVGPNAQEDFPAIAYTVVVDSEGTVYQCHDLDTRTWHSGAVVNGVARNASHIGIAYIGDYEPNAKQLVGLAAAIRYCGSYPGIARELTVEGHRDAPYPTSCPGPTWLTWKVAIAPG